MGTVEIIMLLCGIAFLILSFFVGNEKSSQHPEYTDADLFSAEKISEIKKELESSIEEKADDLLEETKNKLAAASNETIISVDEFTRQTLERINHNHEEVVFMYNMLQNKEEELKKNTDEFKKTIDEFEKKKEEIKNVMPSAVLPSESGIEMARKKSTVKTGTDKKVSKQAVKKVPKSSETVAAVSAEPVLPQTERILDGNEADDDNKISKILALYHNKKSVLEISKALGLGQGEVKLVIDLYGKN